MAKGCHFFHCFFPQEQFIVPCSGSGQINSRENPALLEHSGKCKLHIARPFKLFIDQIIHPASGFNEGRTNNSERPPRGIARRNFDVSGSTRRSFSEGGLYTSGCSQKPFGRIECCRIKSTGKCSPRWVNQRLYARA